MSLAWWALAVYALVMAALSAGKWPKNKKD